MKTLPASSLRRDLAACVKLSYTGWFRLEHTGGIWTAQSFDCTRQCHAISGKRRNLVVRKLLRELRSAKGTL